MERTFPIYWDAAVCHVSDPNNPHVVGKGGSIEAATGDLYIQMYGITFKDVTPYTPLGDNIPGILAIKQRENEEGQELPPLTVRYGDEVEEEVAA
jgi:hypothetical protein